MTKRASAQKKKSLRLEGYDYSNEGGYFVTLIALDFQCVFGNVFSGEVLLSEFGRIAHEEWFKSSKVRSEIVLYKDEFIVMPNHIHGILWIELREDRKGDFRRSYRSGVRATGRLPIHKVAGSVTGPRPKSLSAFVAGYKSVVTKKINKMRGRSGKSVWMRNFHDRVIRNEHELNAIREYIQNNPIKWDLDRWYR